MRIEVRATRLRDLRRARGLTQRSLAEKLGVTQNYIPALEAGSRNASAKLRDLLMELFGCDFDDLFDVVMVDPATSRTLLLKPVDEASESVATG